MVKKEYNSPEYYAQGLRDAFNTLGDKARINFSAKQASGLVTFTFRNQKYSISLQDENGQRALLERFVLGLNSGGFWEEITRLKVQFKRSRTGRVSEEEYTNFIKQEVLSRIVNGQ